MQSVDQQGRTGLLLASRRSDDELAQVLLDTGANPNDADSGGVTALHYAVGRGAMKVVDLLLHCKADADKTDDQGETPLMWASGPSGAAAAAALLAARADPWASTASGRTALMFASGRGDLKAVETLARLQGADLDALDAAGQSAHALALATGHSEVCDLLLQLGASASAPGDGASGSAPAGGAAQGGGRVARLDEALLDAARRGDADAVAALLRRGGGETAVDVDAEVGGETALLVAAGAGAGRAVEVLLEARADPNKADAYLQETPLVRAMLSRCSNELLWLLLEARADPSKGDLTGRTAEAIASSWGDDAAAAILRAAAEGTLGLGELG